MSDAATVHTSAASSYDKITKQHAGGDKPEDVVPYRHFNNYIKKMLVQFAATRKSPTRTAAGGFSVLDCASGRGGDLGKWLYAHVVPPASRAVGEEPPLPLVRYFAADISPECIKEAQRRTGMMTKDLPVDRVATLGIEFHVANCFDDAFWKDEVLAKGMHFDIISVQFAFHYGCDSYESVAKIMANVAAALTPGGCFIATIVDAEELADRIATERLKNGLYNITFPTEAESGEDSSVAQVRSKKAKKLPIGVPYHFQLEGHVDNVEYTIPFEDLQKAAEAAGLLDEPSMSFPFRSKIATYEADPKAKKQLKGASLSSDEKELVAIYRTACFVKKL